jgi:hypothetical protein
MTITTKMTTGTAKMSNWSNKQEANNGMESITKGS